MRESDWRQLEQPYPVPNGEPVGDLGTALGLCLDPLRVLLAEVRNDLDTTTFGIGWWRPAGETKANLQQRIMVSDYLIDALQGVETNLIDLSLHFLELQDWWARESDFVRNSIQLGPDGKPFVKMPPRLRPTDDVIHALVDLHTAGVFRATGSTLDCLASVVIGIGAFETNILRGDWSSLIDRLFDKLTGDGSAGRAVQLELRDDIFTLLAAGQAEWDRWSSDFRNMLVHRGQRMKLSTLRPESHVVDASGMPIIRAINTHLLARDPELSEAEALVLQARVYPTLTEDAHVTIEGLIKDVSTLVAGVASALLDVWKKRRSSPALLVQPVAKQWPKVRRAPVRNFAGYSPGQASYVASAMTMNPAFVRRMKAASLDVKDAATWK